MNKLHIDFPLVFQLFIVNQLRRRVSLRIEISASQIETEYRIWYFCEFLSKSESFNSHTSVLSLSTVYSMQTNARRQHLQKLQVMYTEVLDWERKKK